MEKIMNHTPELIEAAKKAIQGYTEYDPENDQHQMLLSLGHAKVVPGISVSNRPPHGSNLIIPMDGSHIKASKS